jgi:uncharacterized protein YggU (UPF0235/DUF167 family)
VLSSCYVMRGQRRYNYTIMYIRVHANPGARKERVMKIDDTTYQVAVKEPAERNMVNKHGVLMQDFEH